MKKFAVVIFLVMLACVPVFAATITSFNFQSVIGADLSITSNIVGTKSVDPTLTSASFGTITISSNISSWKITVTSLNSGKMLRSGGTETYPYQFTFGTTTGIDLASTYEITKSAPQAATTITLGITYAMASTISPALPAGTYEDTMTISLVAL